MEPGRVVTDPNVPQDSVFYVTAAVAVERVLFGSLQAGHEVTLQLEILVPDETLIAGLVAEFPRERAILFLRNKGTEVAELGFPAEVQAAERKYYRLVRTEAILREFNGRIRIAVDTSSPFLADLEDESFAELVELVQAGS